MNVIAISLRTMLLMVFVLLQGDLSWAQDLEPRRWGHLPKDVHFLGFGGSYTDGDILLDPVLQAKDVEVQLSGVGLAYVYSFGLFGKSARVDVLVPYASGHWEGTVDGEFVRIKRQGFGDPRLCSRP